MNKNIIIIAVVGVAVVLAAYFLLPQKSGKFESVKAPVKDTSQLPSAWIADAAKRIEAGQAQAVLVEIEPKLAQFSDPGMQFHLESLKGDALIKQSKCPEALAAYQLAASNLSSAINKFVPDFTPMTFEEKTKFSEELKAKTAKAEACAK